MRLLRTATSIKDTLSRSGTVRSLIRAKIFPTRRSGAARATPEAGSSRARQDPPRPGSRARQHEEASRIEDVPEPHDGGKNEPGSHDGREIERPVPVTRDASSETSNTTSTAEPDTSPSRQPLRRALSPRPVKHPPGAGPGSHPNPPHPARDQIRPVARLFPQLVPGIQPWLPALSHSSYQRSNSHFMSPISPLCLLYK